MRMAKTSVPTPTWPPIAHPMITHDSSMAVRVAARPWPRWWMASITTSAGPAPISAATVSVMPMASIT